MFILKTNKMTNSSKIKINKLEAKVLKAFGISLIGGLLWVPYYGFYYPIIFLNQYWTSLPNQ